MYSNLILESLRNVDITTTDKNKLKDITQLKIDTSLPIFERLTNFLNEIENPYCFLVGTSTVKIEFSTGQSLQTILKNHFIEHRNRTFE